MSSVIAIRKHQKKKEIAENTKRISEIRKKIKNKRKNKLKVSSDIKIKGCLPESFSSGIFIFHNNKTYTLGFPDRFSRNYVEYKGERFRIEESEDIKSLENALIEKNEKRIKDFKKSALEELCRRGNEAAENIKKLNKSLKEFSVPEFIVNEIFTAYHSKKKEEYSPPELKELTEKKENNFYDKFNEANNLKIELKDPILNRFLKGLNFNGGIGLFGKFYGFNSLGARINLDRLNELKYLGSGKDFGRKYLEEIKRNVKKNILNSLEKQADFVSSEEERFLEARSKLNSCKNFSHKEDREIGFEKINDSMYVVYKKIPKFILKRSENYYLFPESKTGVTIYVSEQKSLKIDNQPTFEYGPGFIFNKGESKYKHPFTALSNEIGTCLCFGAYNEKVNGLFEIKRKWVRPENLEREGFKWQVLKGLKVIEDVLTKGCRGNFYPFIPLNPVNFKEEHISKSKSRELISRNVRFYDNDNYSSNLK